MGALVHITGTLIPPRCLATRDVAVVVTFRVVRVGGGVAAGAHSFSQRYYLFYFLKWLDDDCCIWR